MSMTPRERWLALLNGQQPDRIPTDYWATPEFHQRIKHDLNCPDDESLFRKLHIDRLCHIGARWKLPHHPDDPQADMWGIRYRTIDYGTGSYSEALTHPLAQMQSAAEVHAYRWPDPADFDYQAVRDGIAANAGYRAVHCGNYEPFLLYCYLRGMEQAFEDLLLNTEIADAILGHLFDFHYEVTQRCFEAGQGRIDLFYLAEDLGSQTGPLLSLELYRRFLRPNQIKMADLARSHGIHLFYHTDGAARVFLPDLIDVVGIEVLNPVQWRCPTMEREPLVRDFGDKVIFHGAMDNQHTLPFGTVEEVVAEVKENLRIFGSSPRGWICAPCHNIQPVTPTQNIVTLFETIHEIGELANR